MNTEYAHVALIRRLHDGGFWSGRMRASALVIVISANNRSPPWLSFQHIRLRECRTPALRPPCCEHALIDTSGDKVVLNDDDDRFAMSWSFSADVWDVCRVVKRRVLDRTCWSLLAPR